MDSKPYDTLCKTKMDKQISTKVWIAIAIVAVVIVVLSIWIAFAPPVQPPTKTGTAIPNIPTSSSQDQTQNQSTTGVGDDKQKACLASGGMVSAALCCGQTQDFPNNCAIGACGCAPASSHQIKTCQCGEGKCFDGSTCVQSSQAKASDPSGLGSQEGGKQCTMEAKLCPDGTSVGRTGPNCEFAPCP